MAGKERARETRHDKTHFIVYGSRVYEFSIAEKIYAMTQTLFPHDPRIFSAFFIAGTSLDLNPIIHLG